MTLGPWLPISSSFNPDETCHIRLCNIYIYHSTSGFLAKSSFRAVDLEVSKIANSVQDEMGSQSPHYVMGGGKKSSSSFNPNETCHIHVYHIPLLQSKRLPGKELVGSKRPRNIENNFLHPL